MNKTTIVATILVFCAMIGTALFLLYQEYRSEDKEAVPKVQIVQYDTEKLDSTKVRTETNKPAFQWHDEKFSSGHLAVTTLPDGNSACATYDGLNCLWGVPFASIDFSKVVPVVCGEQFRRIWNTTGYESPQHWCRITLEKAVQNNNPAAKNILDDNPLSTLNEQKPQANNVTEHKPLQQAKVIADTVTLPVAPEENKPQLSAETVNPVSPQPPAETDNNNPPVSSSPSVQAEKKKIEIQWSKDKVIEDNKEAEFLKSFKPRPECEDPNLEWAKLVQCKNEKMNAREKFYQSH
jgi:hypothetical protein